VQSFKLVKESEGTKRKLLIFSMVLIVALILTTFGISFTCWIDDIKSHLKQTDRHTDARDHNTFCVVYDSRKM